MDVHRLPTSGGVLEALACTGRQAGISTDRFACHASRSRCRLPEITETDRDEVWMFVHAVYFWLKLNLGHDEEQEFLERLHALATIESVEACYIGEPAATRREIIDHSYSYALVVLFADENGHDAYQRHPTHDAFRDHCARYWDRVQIYDSVGPT